MATLAKPSYLCATAWHVGNSIFKSSLGERLGLFPPLPVIPRPSFTCKLSFVRLLVQFWTVPEAGLYFKETKAYLNFSILSILIALMTETMPGLIAQPHAEGELGEE